MTHAGNTDKRAQIISRFFPEHAINGFTTIDGTVTFYTQVHSLLDNHQILLDYGAGRGEWTEDPCQTRVNLRSFNGHVAEVIGCDIDAAVQNNPTLDKALQISLDSAIPLADESVDIIVSDWTFEHVDNPKQIAAEFARILKPGGWICARTPNRYSYISIAAQLIRNRYHSKLLRHIQPDRKSIDVFPTRFKLNTLSDIKQHFDADQFENHSYRHEPEPAYFFNNNAVFWLMLVINRFLPAFMKSNLFIFIRKR